MKVLFEKIVKYKLVETKSGAKLLMIEESPNHFWLEQNPMKESKYGVAYRLLKKIYPDLYMFWEIKDGEFTGRMKLEIIGTKKVMDPLIADILHSTEFEGYKDMYDEIEK